MPRAHPLRDCGPAAEVLRKGARARQVELRLTPAGKDALRRAPHAPQERIVEGLARMPAARRAAFAQGLSELLGAMGAGAEPAGMFFEDSPVERQAKRCRLAASRN